MKDVMRAVVVGAAMIPPATLAACSGAPATPPPVPIPPDPNDPKVAVDDAGAPPNEVVRPRTPDPASSTRQMPTRGFRGGR